MQRELMIESGIRPRQVPLLEILKKQKEGLEASLADVNAAIDVLEKNPSVVEVLDTLGKVVRIYG